MKKVLFTATVDVHIKHFHIPYLKMFKENGYEVHVATSEDGEIPYCDVKHRVSFERSPIKINNLKAIKQLKKIISEEKFDIIHCHTPMGGVVTRLAARTARKNGTRVIYTAHGFHFYKGAPLLNWLVYYPIEKFLSRYTDTLITINQEDYDIAKKKFHAKETKLVHGVGVDKSRFDFTMTPEEKKAYRESVGVSENDFVVIQVGELNENKNQLMSIEAMRKLVHEKPDTKLLLVGTGKLKDFYKRKIEEYNLDSNILELGYRKDIPQLLKISNLCISASKREGLPVNIIEAQMSGLPVVATDCRGNRDLVCKENLVGIDDVNALTEKIINHNSSACNVEEYELGKVIPEFNKIYFKKKKILHLLASNSYSGAENVACTIIENLSGEYDMVYCCPRGTIEENLGEKRIRFLPLKKLSFFEVNRAIREYKPDIIHAHDFKTSCIATLLKFDGKIISHIHQAPQWLEKKNIKTTLYKLCLRRINKVIFVSKAIYNLYYYKDALKDKYTILYNYVDKDKIISLSKEKYTSTYELCFFGRLVQEKDPIFFIELVKKLVDSGYSNINACMIGSGTLKAECKKMIEECGLIQNIDLLGFQKNPYKIIKNCNIVVMPSKEEGFGLTAIESVVLNKIVINSGVGGLLEIFKNTDFISKTLEEYYSKIIYIIDNNVKLEAYTQNSILNKFTNLDDWYRKIKSIYEN